ncbi:hypothetical protein F3Y22_tig00111769pilonHSYRG00028 [Hibiscus syriacus]|uniref:Myosin-6 n=1 Tax=Hibiscus syriacus TaxID=106335 RepID=A0A6A2YDG7_HIBSY|nr:hypothetical protein F3Y22_tig00111769pilonHSYRG00028 [Hibiscus syriacus]
MMQPSRRVTGEKHTNQSSLTLFQCGMKASSSAFMIGTLVWVEDPDDAWIDGEVIEINGDEIKVLCTSNKTVVSKTSSAHPKDPEFPPSGVEDMTKLAYLHEPGSYTGSILIAVNPFQRLPHLYDNKVMQKYKGVALGELSPHPFAVADSVYSQSILVSGESGAGKTESTKILMRYLAFMGGRVDNEEEQSVAYQTELFLDKNKDYVVPEHQALLAASKCSFVSSLFPPLPEESSKSSKFCSIGSGFKGVMEAIRISCAGFPFLKQFHKFIERFAVLAPEVRSKSCVTRINELHVRCYLFCGSSDKIAGCKKILEKSNLGGYQRFQIGKTKVFLRVGQMAELDGQRAEILGRAATKIQRRCRQLARHLYEGMRREAASLTIQKYARRFMKRKAYKNLCFSAVSIQASLRALSARNELRFRKQTVAAIVIQAAKETGALQEANEKLEQQVKELTMKSFRSSSSDLPVDVVHLVEAKYPTLPFKQLLKAYVEKIYGIMRDNLKKDLSQHISSCIQHRECSTFSNGEYMKSGLDELEKWCAEATQEIMPEKSKISYDEITNNLCTVLSVQLFYEVYTLYSDDNDNEGVSADVISQIKLLMTDADGSSVLLDEDSSIPF